ncbi:MAG: nicotinate-nucleotide diphosphorylase [Phycisphaerae bacterium]
MWSEETIQLIHAASDEDLAGAGDITSKLLAEADIGITACLVPRVPGVICGLALGPEICTVFADRLNQKLEFEPAARAEGVYEDGRRVAANECVGTVRGAKAAVLAVERTLLNFLGRLSGVATLTRHYVEAARKGNPNVQILDTRKTIPGWRELDKYAVRTGGGTNHRMGLYDAVLIKDNHLAGVPTERLASTLFQMLSRVPSLRAPADQEAEPGAQATGPAGRAGSARRTRRPKGGSNPPYGAPKFVEVEVENLQQLVEVCRVPGVDVVLLDNFSLDEMRKAVEYRNAQGLRDKVALEASGKVTLENVADIAGTGVDRISVGALTHSAPSLDLGLDF